MAAARRHVFVEKVLKRLFPHDPCGQEKRAPPLAAPEAPPEKVRCRHPAPVAGGGTEAPPGRRLYTVALPPEGYVLAAPEPPGGDTGSESESASAGSGEDAGDQDPHDQPKRRRIRKHKSKKKCKNPNNIHVEQAELEQQQTLLEEKLQPWHTDGPTISKNKRRKLKKKQQVNRKKAAGLLTKTSGISFLYEPREGGCEQSDGSEGDGGPGPEAEGPGDSGDAGDGEASVGAQEKADGILDFLKSTQEMYFYDGVPQDPDPAFPGAAEELFASLQARSVPPADLLALERLKALLLLRDPERLQRTLQVFAEQCTMPPEQARVVSALFGYWATHVLPESDPGGSRGTGLRRAAVQQGAESGPGDPAPPRAHNAAQTGFVPRTACGEAASAVSFMPAPGPARGDVVI